MRFDLVSEHASPLAALGGADAGGQNVQVAALAAELGRRGHEVVVHTRRDSPELPPNVRAAAGVTVAHVDAGPPRPLPKDELLPHMAEFGDRLAARWAVRPPDLVHAHFWMSGVAAHRGAAGLDVPVLQTFHALGRVKRAHQGAEDTSPPEREAVEARLARDADLVLATCSDEVRELVAMGAPRHRLRVVPCGIDLDVFAPGPRPERGGRPRILSIGRLVERKGVDTAIRALAEIPDAELVVVGGPGAAEWDADPEVARLRDVAAWHGVRDRVRFAGQVPHDETPDWYRSADVVVSVPWYEPFGTVPLEAMACGTPLVVTSVGGHLDTVVQDGTGLFVPPRDHHGLARELRSLLADRGRRDRLGAAGAARVRERYGWAGLADEVETAYRGAVRRRAPLPARTGGTR